MGSGMSTVQNHAILLLSYNHHITCDFVEKQITRLNLLILIKQEIKLLLKAPGGESLQE